jgi:hypothetical protein
MPLCFDVTFIARLSWTRLAGLLQAVIPAMFFRVCFKQLFIATFIFSLCGAASSRR